MAFRIAYPQQAPKPTRRPKKEAGYLRNKQMNIDLVELPPIEMLKQIFRLDPSIPQGLRWLDRPRSHFRTEIGYNLFAQKYAGEPAGGLCNRYYRLTLTYRVNDDWLSVQLHNHRIIWALFNDKDPGVNLIDHSDINGRNNEGGNLRLADGCQSSQNRRRRSDNRSGIAGVCFRSDIGKWRARITVERRVIDLGCHDSFEQAIYARRLAERTYFGEFAPNHEVGQ